MSAAPDLQALVASARRGTQLCIGGASLSGDALVAAVLQAAAGLRAAGFHPGNRLAVHLHRCLEEPIALLAAMVAGGIAVPINPKSKDDQVAHVLADSEPWGIVTSATKASLLRDPERVFGGRRLFAVGTLARPASAPWPPPAHPGAPAPIAVAPGDAATLLYTSGSTGLAKGIVQDHRNLALGAAIVADYLGLTAADHILALLPFSFDYGLNQLMSALHAGCQITAADHLGAGELAQLLRSVRPTGLAGVPSLWHEVAEALRTGVLTRADGDSLRYVTNSGGKLQEPDIRTLRSQWPHVRIFAMYGLTEAFRSAFLDPAEIDRRPHSFGKALPGVDLLLVDPVSGAVLDGEATGELVHAGALVARGYWQNPAATAARFRPDPRGRPGTVVFSGDLVRRDADGFLSFVARADRMLKVLGHRVSPDEVAQAVVGMPGVGEVAVFGHEGGAAGHALVLCVAGDPADPTLRERVLRQCRSRLPAYMLPKAVHVLPSLPHNQNGKVDVPALMATIPACTDSR
ncbi:MAG: AMP-binding protein [Planctomycetes bacterium]|nr:AMP-binding protein [Planctomycetota bacterium]